MITDEVRLVLATLATAIVVFDMIRNWRRHRR